MRWICFSLLVVLAGCHAHTEQQELPTEDTLPQQPADIDAPFLTVLGTTQDGGAPHMGCLKECCQPLLEAEDFSHQVVCLGISDPASNQYWMFEATPDFTAQSATLLGQSGKKVPDGIFLTHAHIGHYTGLMFLGREVLGADSAKVFAMPRMREYLTSNGPWSQLVSLGNIELQAMDTAHAIRLTANLTVEAILVPHRDEFSETVGFIIQGPSKRVLFIPDIDKWSRWETDIRELLGTVDVAFLDATFFDQREIPHRDMSEIPHPFVVESMEAFKGLSDLERSKIHFIHFNHSNPLLREASEEWEKVKALGFNRARKGMKLEL